MIKRVLLILIPTIIFCSCNYPGEGALGGWTLVKIPILKYNFKLALDSFKRAHPESVIPEKWQYDSDSWQSGDYAFLEGDVLYLNKGREEMFFFSYIPITLDQKETSTTIALRSVFKNRTWYRKADLEIAEQKRISKRFHDEILAELGSITNVKFRSEIEKYEQPINHHPTNERSNYVLEIDSAKFPVVKKVLTLSEKSDSVAAVITHGKFDFGTVLALEEICGKVKPEDLSMQTFTTTVEDLFYHNMARFTNYYIENPNSCLKGKLKLSMEEYMSAYAPKDRLKKNFEKRMRVLNKAKVENFSPKQMSFIQALFDSLDLR